MNFTKRPHLSNKVASARLQSIDAWIAMRLFGTKPQPRRSDHLGALQKTAHRPFMTCNPSKIFVSLAVSIAAAFILSFLTPRSAQAATPAASEGSQALLSDTVLVVSPGSPEVDLAALVIDTPRQDALSAATQAEQYATALKNQLAEQSKKKTFISEWTERINSYLDGSPLAGEGEAFARAAFAYGVDPRWSPAISAIESSKGAACFASHNAWGWGGEGWLSWDEAIDAHVAGLAAGYGGQNTLEAAKKYCPTSYQSWYANVESEMAKI